MRRRIVFADECGVADAVRLVEEITSGRVGREVQFDVELHRVGSGSGLVAESELNAGVVNGRHPFSKIWDLRGADSLAMLADFLREQPMGTKVGLFVSRANWKVLSEVCSSVGLSAEEMEGTPYGPMSERVFCIGCYGFNPPTSEERIVCAHCGRVLSVSTHYSRRLDAVFGYLTISQVAEVLADD